MYKQYYTYIMSNKTDTTLYIGVTDDLERRTKEHKSGLIPGFTQKYKCHKLVYYEQFSDINQAIDREKQLKHWSRSKKDMLIDRVNHERNDLYETEISPLGPSALGRNDKRGGFGRNDSGAMTSKGTKMAKNDNADVTHNAGIDKNGQK